MAYRYADGTPVDGTRCSIYDQNNTLIGGGLITAALKTFTGCQTTPTG